MKTTEVLVLVLVICGLAHAQYNNGRRSGGSRTRGFTLRDIFSNYRQYDIYGGDYNRGNAGPRYDVYGSYDNRGGYDNRGSYDNRGGYDGGYGNRGGYDGGYDIPGLFDIRDFFRGRREQKKVFGVCATDSDCLGSFFCDNGMQCEYMQPRPVPCDSNGQCGENYKYMCNRNNVCELCPFMTPRCGKGCEQGDCDILMSESVGRTCNTTSRQCEWVFRACAPNDACPEGFACLPEQDGTKTCQFNESRSNEGFPGQRPNLFPSPPTFIPPSIPNQRPDMFPNQRPDMFPNQRPDMFPNQPTGAVPGQRPAFPTPAPASTPAPPPVPGQLPDDLP